MRQEGIVSSRPIQAGPFYSQMPALPNSNPPFLKATHSVSLTPKVLSILPGRNSRNKVTDQAFPRTPHSYLW